MASVRPWGVAAMATTTKGTRYPDSSRWTPCLQLKGTWSKPLRVCRLFYVLSIRLRDFIYAPSTRIPTTLFRDSGMLKAHPRGRAKMWTQVCELFTRQWAISQPGVASHSGSPAYQLPIDPSHFQFRLCPKWNTGLQWMWASNCLLPIFISAFTPAEFRCTLQSVPSFLAYLIMICSPKPQGGMERVPSLEWGWLSPAISCVSLSNLLALSGPLW